MPFKEECGVCHRVLSYHYLRRCQRCGRLYCRDCMVPDVSTGDPTKLFCLNCARRIVSPRTVYKYAGLAGYLRFRGSFTNTVKLSFARIDGIIGESLPIDAYRQEKWWNNLPRTTHARGWLDAGWEVHGVNLREGYVVFKKVREVRFKKRNTQVDRPFTPVRIHFPRPKTPSKTKVSKLYARVKNLERQRASPPAYHGSFKSKPRHEKRLFRTDQRPQ